MHICFVKHSGCDKKFIFDCTDTYMDLGVGVEVVCETSKGLQRGTVVVYPIKIVSNTHKDLQELIEAAGAYWPLKRIIRKFGDVPNLLEEEKQVIARQYILDHTDCLPF